MPVLLYLHTSERHTQMHYYRSYCARPRFHASFHLADRGAVGNVVVIYKSGCLREFVSRADSLLENHLHGKSASVAVETCCVCLNISVLLRNVWWI